MHWFLSAPFLENWNKYMFIEIVEIFSTENVLQQHAHRWADNDARYYISNEINSMPDSIEMFIHA